MLLAVSLLGKYVYIVPMTQYTCLTLATLPGKGVAHHIASIAMLHLEQRRLIRERSICMAYNYLINIVRPLNQASNETPIWIVSLLLSSLQ